MKITKELFDKLDKKKKEEYKSKLDKIKEIRFWTLGVTYFYWMIYFLAFMFIVIPLWKIAFGSTVIKPLLYLLTTGLRVLVLAIGIGLYIDLFILIYKILMFDKIKKEYFKIEVK